jgi:hypothetical protein
VTAQSVARISWIDNQPAPVDDLYRLLYQATLGIVRVNFEKLGHGNRF